MKDAKEKAEEEDIDQEFEPLSSKCIDRLAEFIEECSDQEIFNELSPSVMEEIVSYINEWN